MSNSPCSYYEFGRPLQFAQSKQAVAGIRALPWLLLSLVLMTIWLLLYPYGGMRHDARLYTLQALSHLRPDLYLTDIFLRFGSQDSFTLFTPIYSLLASWLGIEHAAAALTAIAQFVFLGACWRIARTMDSALAASVTLALVLILPGNYGSDFIFTYFEIFITPRLLAEGLVLLSIIAWLGDRRLLTGSLLLAALLIHPIMAMAGVIFIVISIALKYPRILLLATLTGMIVVALASLSPLGVKLRFDDEWFAIVNARSPSLFLQNWLYADWARLSVPAVSLWLTAFTASRDREKDIAKAALFTAGGGLLVTLIGSDIFRLVIVSQGQAWRWLWLSTLLALLLLPKLIQQLWQQNKAGQGAVFLLCAAWLVRNEASSLGLIVFAAAAGWVSFKHIGTEQTWATIRRGGAALLALTIIWLLAINRLQAGLLLYSFHLPNWIDQLHVMCEDGLIPLAFLGIALLIIRRGNRWAQATGTACALATFVILGWYSWHNWVYEEYSPEVVHEMEPWRELIPEREEVLWMDGAIPTWLALQRPSYISGIQATVTLFSRPAALTLQQRDRETAPIFPDAKPLLWIPAQNEKFKPSTTSLREICAQIPVRFLVTKELLDAPPIALVSPKLPPEYQNSKLYRCEQNS